MGWLKKMWKKVEHLGHKVGIDKDHLNSIAPVISAVNPVAGAVYGAATGGKKGLIDSLKGTVFANILGNKGLLNLSASGRIPQLKETISKLVNSPNRILTNIVRSGGDVKKGLLLSLLETNPNLRRFTNSIYGAIGDMANINLKNFGIKDAVGIYSIIKFLKEKPLEPPTAPQLKEMGQDVVDNLVNVYNTDLNDNLKKSLHSAQIDYGNRGLERSGLLIDQERKMREQAAKNLADYKAKLGLQQMQYNNQLRQQNFGNEMSRYGSLADIRRQQMQSIGDLAASYLAGRGWNLPGYPQMPQPIQQPTQTIPQNGIDWGSIISSALNDSNKNNINIPDINLNNEIEKNRKNYWKPKQYI